MLLLLLLWSLSVLFSNFASFDIDLIESVCVLNLRQHQSSVVWRCRGCKRMTNLCFQLLSAAPSIEISQRQIGSSFVLPTPQYLFSVWRQWWSDVAALMLFLFSFFFLLLSFVLFYFPPPPLLHSYHVTSTIESLSPSSEEAALGHVRLSACTLHQCRSVFYAKLWQMAARCKRWLNACREAHMLVGFDIWSQSRFGRNALKPFAVWISLRGAFGHLLCLFYYYYYSCFTLPKVLFKPLDHRLPHFVLPDLMVRQPCESRFKAGLDFEAKACSLFLRVFGACSRPFALSLFNTTSVPLLSVFTLCAGLGLVLLVQLDGLRWWCTLRLAWCSL